MDSVYGNNPANKEISQRETMGQEIAKNLPIADSHLLDALLNNAPDHIYFKDADSRFIKISDSQAKTFGMNDPSEAIGKTDFDFFSQEHADQAFQDEKQIMQTGKPLTKEEKETWPNRPDTWVITTKMPLRDEQGKIVGTFGISKDITEEKRLRENIEDLQKDAGRTFHTLSATLLQSTHAIIPTINALGPDPFKEESLPSTERIWKELVGLKNSLVSTIRNLLDVIEAHLQTHALSPDDWAELHNLLHIIEDVEKINIAEQRVPVLRRAARQVIDVLSRIKKGNLKQELVRDIKRSAEQLEQMTCLVALHQVLDRIIETDYMVRDLRERVLTGIKKTEKPEICEVRDLVKEAIKGLTEYAEHRGIDLRLDNHLDAVCVLAGRHDIIRVVNNLLHNAIKYSWVRDQGVKPWIEIRGYIKVDQVYVEIEDYGVPIPRDEIDGNLIFQLGWRGRLSSQRGRIGTGIGLADARDTARHYGGEVVITSRPAKHYSSIDDLTVPHIKTAILSLPIHRHKGK